MLIGSVKNTESIEFRENINRSIPLFIKLYPSLKEFYKVRYRDLLEDFNDSYFYTGFRYKPAFRVFN